MGPMKECVVLSQNRVCLYQGIHFKKGEEMKKTQKDLVSRCFGNYCPKNSGKKREEALKAALKKVADKKRMEPVVKRAQGEINGLLKLSRGSLINLLPLVVSRVVDKRYPRLVLEILLERIRRNQWDKLSPEDKCLVIQTEAFLILRK